MRIFYIARRRAAIANIQFSPDTIPPKYQAMDAVLTDMQNTGTANLNTAEEILRRNMENPKDMPRAYYGVHDGLVGMATMYTAALCTPVLGSQFLLVRD